MKKENKDLEFLEKIWCENCGETHMFRFEDNQGELFIGLQDILKCLWLAQKNGAVPPIEPIWWLDVERQYSTQYSFPE